MVPVDVDTSICVVIPTFNRGHELARALDSLVAQTDTDFDVVICDDGSTEDISLVVQRYQHQLRVQLLRIENSGGPARPRNVAMAAATTHWVSFLDSDDWWYPQRMQEVKKHLMLGSDIVYHQLTVCRADGKSPGKPVHGKKLGHSMSASNPLMQMIRLGNPLPTSATTVRRTLMLDIGGFSEISDLASVEDFDAWLRLASRGIQMTFIGESLGAYWIGNDNISGFTPRQYEQQKNLFTRQLALLPLDYRAKAQSNFSYLLGSYALQLGLPGAYDHFNKIQLTQEPIRWLKLRIKLWLHRQVKPV